MRKSIVIAAMFTMFLSLWNKPASAYEQYFTYPGTRAMGMAGAFIAQANDSSAVWYNPAGLAQPGAPKFDFTIEYGQVPKRNDAGDYGGEGTLKFASYLYNDSIKHPWVGIGGISYFVPYQISLNISDCPVSCTINPPIGRVDASYSQISPALAKAFLDGRVSMGFTADILYMQSAYEDANDLGGFGWSIGSLIKLLDTQSLDINGGILWRSSVDIDWPGVEISNYLPGRPTMRGIGLNIKVPSQHFLLSSNVDYGKVLWSQAIAGGSSVVDVSGMDYSKNAFGGEIIFPIFERSSIALRGGWNVSTPDDVNKFVKINSVTYGVGINMKNFVVDVASENREFSGGSPGSNGNFNFYSVSMSLQY